MLYIDEFKAVRVRVSHKDSINDHFVIVINNYSFLPLLFLIPFISFAFIGIG